MIRSLILSFFYIFQLSFALRLDAPVKPNEVFKTTIETNTIQVSWKYDESDSPFFNLTLDCRPDAPNFELANKIPTRPPPNVASGPGDHSVFVFYGWHGINSTCHFRANEDPSTDSAAFKVEDHGLELSDMLPGTLSLPSPSAWAVVPLICVMFVLLIPKVHRIYISKFGGDADGRLPHFYTKLGL